MCSPQVYYLGQQHPSSENEIDVYYDELDIERNFQVIGQLSSSDGSSPDSIAASMTAEAKKRGGHAIWFLPFDTFDGVHSVKANVLRYK